MQRPFFIGLYYTACKVNEKFHEAIFEIFYYFKKKSPFEGILTQEITIWKMINQQYQSLMISSPYHKNQMMKKPF